MPFQSKPPVNPNCSFLLACHAHCASTDAPAAIESEAVANGLDIFPADIPCLTCIQGELEY